ncbi:MAG TPA: pilin [Candidatus Saccharimonadales bacterium]|nr:pilin [Candidatus Saccharimonadales bacterium]
MIKKLKNLLAPLLLTVAMSVPTMVALPMTAGMASACSSGVATNIAKGASDAAGGSDITCNDVQSGDVESSVSKIAQEVVKVFSIVVGAASIFMIVYGGFRYITSGGDTNKVGSAKNTLIYAILGLVVVALAQLIVHFVLGAATSNTSSLGH